MTKAESASLYRTVPKLSTPRRMIALIYNGQQRGFTREDDMDLYTVWDAGHPAHGATFSVPAGAHVDVVAAKAEEVARKFSTDRPGRQSPRQPPRAHRGSGTEILNRNKT